MNRLAIIAMTAASALALGACAKKPPAELPPPPETNSTPTPTGTGMQTGAAVPGTQAHFSSTMAGQDTIYFDTDTFDIDSQDAAALRSQAQYLTQFANVRATVAGHADERGTREYNLALGERRANSAKNYLVSLGIASNRINTVSYGEERPADVGSNEAAWSRNRRAVTVVVN